ncbi:MAG: arginine deiminase [Thermoleophilia bacterium]|nr:arginine deiminase [Thermoleophilia bacterium]
MTAPLRRVLVRRPGALERWRDYGWRTEPDPAGVEAEHEALRAALAEAGAEVVVANPLDGNPDAVYVFDPALLTARGAVLLRPGKKARRGEPDAIGDELEAAGVTVRGQLQAPACAEGGDLVWLDEHTLAVGLGYRTNEAGAAALAEALPDIDVLAFDLPHCRGPGEVLHLMSLLSPLDADLALVQLPLLPTRLVQLLRERGVELVEVAEEEFDAHACNVLALGPRRVLAFNGNQRTRRRLEAAGVDVRVVDGRELGLKGEGGPTCLTQPLHRAVASL